MGIDTTPSRGPGPRASYARARSRVRAPALAALALALAALVAVCAPDDARADIGTPVGATVAWGGAAVPAGWLRADGTAVSRVTYAELFAVVGTTYGAGDGSTTFNVPDLRQRFPLGQATAGTGSAIASTGGAIDHAHGVPSHSHSLSADPGHTHDFASHLHSIPGHNHGSSLSGTSMTAGGSHNHQGSSGRYFIIANGSGTLYNLATGGIAVKLRATTTSDGDHSHNFNGPIGPATDGDNPLTSGTQALLTSATVGAHSHGAATGTAAPATGTANPPFIAVNYLIKASSTAGTPCGAIWWSGRSTPSPSALAANGTAVGPVAQSTLFGCLGTTFGAGDGSTTFNLPDLRGRFALGRAAAGTGSTLGGPAVRSTTGTARHTRTASLPTALTMRRSRRTHTRCRHTDTTSRSAPALEAHTRMPPHREARSSEPPTAAPPEAQRAPVTTTPPAPRRSTAAISTT